MGNAIETEQAFNQEHIREPIKLISEYRFRVGDLDVWVTIKLYSPIRATGVHFRQSHFIKTPLQGGPYRTSSPFNNDEQSAINQVVGAMNQYYLEAVQKNHQPDNSWLVPNPEFNA